MNLHDFVPRKTLHNAKLNVCTNCGATKNHLNENSKCTRRDSKNIEKFLKPNVHSNGI